jgi:hypothetical protein
MAKTIYTKTDASGKQIFSDCRVIEIAPKEWVSNPTPEMIAAAGWVEFIPPVVPPAPQDEPDMAEMVAAVKRMLSSSVEDLTDEQALEVASLYPTWASKLNTESELQPGQRIEVGERLWDNGQLWKCITAHEALKNWRPEDSPSLYVRVTIEEWPAWVQPLGSEDAYKAGDKVSHNDKHWISDVDGNVWEPGVYGWTEQS